MDFSFLENRLAIGILFSVVGVALTLLTQRILNKRGLFTYFVRHDRVGISAQDAVFGTVRVTWNDNLVANLYSSTIELRNESLGDYENVVVRVFTNDTILLNERSEIVGTTYSLDWTEEYARNLTMQPGAEPTEAQKDIYAAGRDYLIPTMNRSQIVRLTFLNAAKTEQQPTLWLDVLHKGVKLKFRTPQTEFFGVSQRSAAIVGASSALVFLGIVVVLVDTAWLAAVVSLIYGLVVLIPGALLVKLWRWLRDWWGG